MAGFEANAGFLLAAAGDYVISTLINVLPQRFTHSDRIQNFSREQSQAIIEQGKPELAKLLATLGFKNINIESVDEIDGLRMTS